MLQALIHHKISKWLTKPPWQIEDLLTSVVFGASKYTGLEGWRTAMRYFLGTAVFEQSGKRVQLSHVLPEIEEMVAIEYEFWPSWGELSVHTKAADVDFSTVFVDPGEPEVLIKITTRDRRKVWLLVEVKLNIGKSRGPSERLDQISDQLAKYCLLLKHHAEKANAGPLCLVYITPGILYPREDIEQSLEELRSKHGGAYPPIYWVSWRRFVKAVEQSESAEPIPLMLRDVLKLLRDEWGFYYEEIQQWPQLLSLPLLLPWHVLFPWCGHFPLPKPWSTTCNLSCDSCSESIPVSALTQDIIWKTFRGNLPQWILEDCNGGI